MDLFQSTTELDSGVLLLANPFLPDPNFKRTVVLLVEHDETNGSLGFVLNRRSDVRIHDILEGLPETAGAPVYIGGPVQLDTLHFVHRRDDLVPGGAAVASGLFWGGNYESLRASLAAGSLSADDVRFFLGYSGWSAGQLADEVREKSWIVTPAAAEHAFQPDADTLWRSVLRNMGQEYAIIANFPEDPRLN